ncbi:MAG: threonine/serine exporter family protein [Acidimicrobiales bacterium]|nr:threonine/serine exporter family protein [Acidimicrobiales bacterium]
MSRSDDAELVVKIGQVAHKYGMPGFELDRELARLARALRVDLTVIATPRLLDCVVVDQAGATERRMLAPLDEVAYNIEKLSRTVHLMRRIEAGDVDDDAARRELDAIEVLPAPYPAPAVGIAYAACGAGFAVILGSASGDVVLASALSIVVFLVGCAAARFAWLSRRVYVVSAFAAALLAGLAGHVIHESDTPIVALCSFVVLVPGLGLALGALELAEGQTLIGWHRFIAAAVQTFELFAGAAIGTALVRSVVGLPDAPDVGPSSTISQWAFLMILMIGLVVVFQVPPRIVPWAVAAGMLAYAGLEVGSRSGSWQGPFLGALALGLFSTLYARGTSHANPLVVVLPGVLILVPGVAAYASLRTFDAEFETGIAASGQGVLIQIVAILAGLFTAASIVELGRALTGAAPSGGP